MKPRILLVSLLISLPAVAADEQPSAPQGDQQPVAESPYLELNKRVQEKLRAESFYSGPISGDIGFNTQAAIAQFQLSRALPASGSLDDTTLAALGLEQQAERPAEAGTGASAPAR